TASGAENLSQSTSATSYTYTADQGAAAATPPRVTTAFVNQIAANGSSWLDGGNVGIGTPNPSGQLEVDTSSSATKGLVIKGNTQQSANLLEVQDSSGNPLAVITPSNGDGTTSFLLPSTVPGKGPFSINYGSGNIFNGTQDPILDIGYNQDEYGAKITPNQPGLSWITEANYNDGSPDLKMEAYLQYVSANGGSPIRPLFFQFDRVTNALTSAVLRGNPVNIQAPNGSNIASFSPGNVTVGGLSGGTTSLVVQAAAGQTGILQLGYNGVNNQLTIHPRANSAAITLGSQIPLLLYNTPNGAPGASLAVGAGDNSAVGVFAVGNSSPSLKGLVVRGRSGQVANLQEWQNSSNTVLDAINASGNLGLGTANPNSTLQVAGSQAVQVNTVSANYTLSDSDYFVGVSGQSGPVTLTLPSAAGRNGRVYAVNDESGAAVANPITLQAQPGQTIDGAGAEIINTNYGGLKVISNGSNWFIIGTDGAPQGGSSSPATKTATTAPSNQGGPGTVLPATVSTTSTNGSSVSGSSVSTIPTSMNGAPAATILSSGGSSSGLPQGIVANGTKASSLSSSSQPASATPFQTTVGSPTVLTPLVGVGTANPQAGLTVGQGLNLATEMRTPQNVSASPTTGGTLSAGTYYFVVSASDGHGTTLASSEVSATVDGVTSNAVALSWNPVPGAVSYQVYKGTASGAENLS
ncbi:MAG: hypothetical protein JO112_15980, partial [Planctomycetes bacterium]|nr:hypothetical protein [Planctomycetota bacterium]